MNNLKTKTLKGVLWNSFGTIGGGITGFIATIVLARLLSPAHFGVLELIMIFIYIADTFVDSGFSQVLIADKKAGKRDYTSVFYINLSIALFVYLILYFVSPALSHYFNIPDFHLYARVAFIAIILNSLSLIQNTIYTKEMRFREISIATFLATLIAGIIAIYLAYVGWGIWALVANYVLIAFLKTLFLWVQSSWLPKGFIAFSSIRKYFKSGSNLLMQGISDKIVTNLESFLIGKHYSSDVLGCFSQARKINAYSTQTLVSIVQRVTFPALATIESEEQLLSAYRKVLRLTMFVVVPLSSFLIVVAPTFITVLLGKKWLGVAPFLQLWSFCSLLVAFYSIFINIFLVKNETKRLLRLSLMRQVLRVLAILIFVRYSIELLIVGLIMVTLFSAIQYCTQGGKLISYSLKKVGADIFATVISAIIASLVTHIVTIFLLPHLSPIISLCLQTMIISAIYILGCYLLRSPAFYEFVEVTRKITH